MYIYIYIHKIYCYTYKILPKYLGGGGVPRLPPSAIYIVNRGARCKVKNGGGWN